jgi:RHS repeat-associated protein
MSIRYLVGNFVDSITRFDTTVVSNQYTGGGYLAAVHYPDETNRYTYLKNGLVQTLENSEGIISNGWNSASWLMSQTCTAGILPASSVAYSYDLVGNVTNATLITDNDSLITSYSYDPAERLSTISTALTPSTNLTFSYTYNSDNGRISTVSNASLRAEYEYDIMDRITSIDWKNSWGTTILAFDYQYNAAGMITNRVLTGGSGSVTTGYQYDDLDRLISVDDASSFVQYSYDAAGNRLSKSGDDFAVSYTLGTGNRLASWDATSTNVFESFRTLEVRGSSSEPIGTDNRWGQLWVSNSVAVTPDVNGTNFSIEAFTVGMGTQTVVAAIRDQAGNVGYATNEIFISVVTNAQYGYSAAGCLTNISYNGTEYSDSKALGWNAQYQLISVSSATSAVEYSYDVLGRWTSRTSHSSLDTNEVHFVCDGNQVVADVDENGSLLRSYVWGTGVDNLLSMTVYTNGTTNTYYALTDQQGTVHALADSVGQIVERYEYDAWGKVLGIYNGSGDELSASALGNRYMWQGREYDVQTGLYYFRARWYSPILGRFISKDLIGISGGLNQYVFCSNNPANARDPMGLCETEKRSFWEYITPDYVTLNINIAIPNPWTATLVGWSGTATIDRYDNFYWSPAGAGIGKSATFVSISLQNGWLTQTTKPSSKQLNSFLTGHSVNVGAGFIVGGSGSWSPGNGSAVQIGLFSPQVGGSYNYSFGGK